MLKSILAVAGASLAVKVLAQCPDYSVYSTQLHPPFSGGRYNLSYMRPDPSCRTFVSQDVEDTIGRVKSAIADPDLKRLFENSFPNTLDTAIKWKGTAVNSDEDLTFVITGDINAMWLRDSANQMQSYLSVLKPSSDGNSIASLYRGVINLQSRYISTSPFCNSFQPPSESNIPPVNNGAVNGDTVKPTYSGQVVFECKYEIDSLAAFLEVSSNYYNATQDLNFFQKYQWASTVRTILDLADSMMTPTYGSDGSVNTSPYTFQRTTTSSTETLDNGGRGNLVGGGTGLVRSAFRPSDDSTIFQLFVPGNAMFAHFLNTTAPIMQSIDSDLASRMTTMSASIDNGIKQHGMTQDRQGNQIFAYEIDGFDSTNVMDDANIPSLLSLPMIGYVARTDPVYQATRNFVLSAQNPYFMRGPVMNAVGGPHDGPGRAWPMANIVRIITSDDDAEITAALREIVSSTAGLGLIHESINSFNQDDWTRQWFSWANGLFGQAIVDLADRKPAILQQSFQ